MLQDSTNWVCYISVYNTTFVTINFISDNFTHIIRTYWLCRPWIIPARLRALKECYLTSSTIFTIIDHYEYTFCEANIVWVYNKLCSIRHADRKHNQGLIKKKTKKQNYGMVIFPFLNSLIMLLLFIITSSVNIAICYE